jgi:hypothetical protein
MAPGDFNFEDYGTSYASTGLPDFREGLGNLQPIQPNPQGLYHGNGAFGAAGNSVAGAQRKADSTITSPAATSSRLMNFEDASRLAAEEDKRRRNTAASARFRIKKKQREQALEKSAKEMTEKVGSLESRISQLETENKWLKNLIMEKNDGKGGAPDVSKLWKDFSSKQESEKKAKAAKSGSGKGKSVPVPASPTESSISVTSTSNESAMSLSSKDEK